MDYIDTSIYVRATSVTSSHVESDIVDASGHYKPFEKYDTLKIADPSAGIVEDPRALRLTHLYVGDPGHVQDEIDALKALYPELLSSSRVF